MLVWALLIINREDVEDGQIRIFAGINGEERARAEFIKAPSEYDEAEYYIELMNVRVE